MGTPWWWTGNTDALAPKTSSQDRPRTGGGAANGWMERAKRAEELLMGETNGVATPGVQIDHGDDEPEGGAVTGRHRPLRRGGRLAFNF